MDVDDALCELGEFGRYQKLLVWLVCLPACIPCGFGAFNQLFMAEVPEDYWCRLPPHLSADGNASEARRRFAVGRCHRYSASNWTAGVDGEGVLEPCLDGYEFDSGGRVQSSIVIDFELVCDKAIYPTLGLVALNLGGPMGVYLFGLLNDRIGRRLSFFACLSTFIAGNMMTAFSASFWPWAASRLVVGLTIPAIYQIPFIIALELVGPNYRSFVTVLTCLFYTLGLILLAGVTYLVRDWSLLSLATSAPFLLYAVYWFWLPESPRWLLAQNRVREALAIFETMARTNGRPMSETTRLRLLETLATDEREEKRGRNYTASSLCATANMRLKTFLITLNWFANETVYVGLSYYGPSLGDNQHLSFFLSSVVEIPSYLVCWLLMDRWGRRWPLCVCMVVSGLSCIGTVLLPADAVTATLVLYLLSKSAISASFLIIYPFAGELYPTELRGVGIGTSAYIAGLGLIIIPFITYLGSENLIMPLIIMGIVSVVGGLSGLRLPETLYQRLPQTLEDGEAFGKDFTAEDCLRCIPLNPKTSRSSSYENLEMLQKDSPLKRDVVATASVRKLSFRNLARQASIMDAPKDSTGATKMTYWF